MRKTLILFIVFILLLSGCVKEETMYIKPFMLAEEDINNMLERHGGVFVNRKVVHLLIENWSTVENNYLVFSSHSLVSCIL